MSLDPNCKNKKFFIARRISKAEAGKVQEMLKSLEDGKGAEVYQKLKTLTLQKRVTKKDIL